MAIRAISCVWERSRAKGSPLLLLLAIADYAKDDGRWAWPSTRTLARKTRLGERTVWQLLKDLEGAGELEIDNETQPGRRYLHVRCVCEEWPANPEYLPSTSGGRAGPADGTRATPPAKFAGGLTPQGLQSLHPTPAAEQTAPLIPGAGDPDPLRNRQGIDPEEAVRPLGAPVETVENLAEALLAEAPELSIAELVVGLRQRAEARRLFYTPDEIAGALMAAFRRRGGDRG